MATLELTVGQGTLGANAERTIELLAELFPVGDGGAGRESRSVAVASGSTVAVHNLPPGVWQVRLTAPSGARVVRDVVLGDADTGEVKFAAPEAEVTGASSQPPNDVRGSPFNFSTKIATTGSFRGDDRAARPPSASIVELNGEADRVAGGQWGVVADLIGKPARSLGRQTNLASGPSSADWVLAIGDQFYGSGSRCALAVSSGRVSVLQFIPAPWDIFGPEGDIDILVSAVDRQLVSAVRVTDPAIAGVIAYLGAGSLQAGASLMHSSPQLDFVEMLRGKVSNPLRACAAAYVLLGSADLSKPAKWHGWIKNLAHWFDGIPDGLIILARFKQLTGDRDNVADLVKQALARGIPHYALGISWLRELMTYFPDDEVIQGHLALVNVVAAHVEVSNPFTCLRWRVVT